MSNWKVINQTTGKLMGEIDGEYATDSAIETAFELLLKFHNWEWANLISGDNSEIHIIDRREVQQWWDEANAMDPAEAEAEEAYWSQFDNDSDLGDIW